MLRTEKTRNSIDRTILEQDFYSVLNPITWFCRVSGIFPLWLKGPVAGKRKYSTSYVSIIYGMTVLALSITGLSMWTELIDERVMKESDAKVSITSIHMEFMLQTSSMVVIVLTAILTRNKFANAIDSLSSQDKMLRKLGTRLDHAADLKQNYIRMGVNILIMIVLFACHLYHESEIYLRYPLIWIAWIYPNAIRIVNICLFGDVLLALRQRFAAINEHLRSMIGETKTVSEPSSNSERLRSIAKIHGALYEVTLNVNKMFGLNIIVGVVCVLKGVTTSIYHIIREFKFQINISWMKILGFINWGMISFTHTVYLVTVCNLAQYQASLTGKLIHKFQIDEGDTPFNTVVQSFSLQLYHENIEFSAAGIFPLDATLLQSILGAVTTFLIILLQFQTSPRELIESRITNNSLPQEKMIFL